MRFHVGKNVPGYLPEGDVIAEDGMEGALIHVRSLIDALADNYGPQCAAFPNETPRDHCGWCEIYSDTVMELAGIDGPEGDTLARFKREGGLSILFSPPEGPDIVVWATPCTAANQKDCDICSDPDYGVQK